MSGFKIYPENINVDKFVENSAEKEYVVIFLCERTVKATDVVDATNKALRELIEEIPNGYKSGCSGLAVEKEKIADVIKALMRRVGELESKIFDLITELPNYGKECECAYPEPYIFVENETSTEYCIKCGGIINTYGHV